ncbi:3045_t:CDS:2 [Funneliformis geosporum]|nr:3045_t:CDS:2 [Funneliformis geosporum]
MTEINEVINVQPLAFVHNNELVCVEEGNVQGNKKFSCFKIFKLKGPIDVNYVIDAIFPPSVRNYYDLNVCEYKGSSAKVKFQYNDQTPTDLIGHMKNSASKFYHISENGLADWAASDTVTFKSLYRNVDLTSQQLDSLSDVSSSDDNVLVTSSSSSLEQLYPIIDEESFEQEMKELSEKIKSSSPHLLNYDLEKIFHKSFQRRDKSITFRDLRNEFFSQIHEVVCLVNKPLNSKKINHLVLGQEQIINDLTRLLYKHVENYISKGACVTLWNLINAFKSVQFSFKLLKETDAKFVQILKAQQPHFMAHLTNMDQIIMDVLILLEDNINSEKYERLQRRLVNFVGATEDLMRLIMIINQQFNEELEKLEKQEKNLTTKLYIAAMTIGFAALIIGGFILKKRNYLNKAEKYFGSTLACTTGVAMITGLTAKIDLQNSIKQQTNILDQLKKTHLKLFEWKNLGKLYIDRDIDGMNKYRMNLADNFVTIRFQCEELGKIFD